MSAENYIVFRGIIELYAWSHTSAGGRRIILRLNDRDDLKHFEAERMVKKSRTGKPRAGENYSLTFVQQTENAEPFPIDAWYRGPSWSERAGARVTFELHDDLDLSYFKGMKTADVEDNGEELALAIVQIDESTGMPIDQNKRTLALTAEQRKKAGLKGGPKSKRVARMCEESEFVTWFSRQFRLPVPTHPDTVAAKVREICGIQSRAMLDHDESAWALWMERIEGPFVKTRERATL